jgi:alpha-1,3-rhamnosyl/mannosyltransferase
VTTFHDLAPLLIPDSKPPAVERAFRTAMPRSARAATRVACVSRTTAGDVRRLWNVPEERIRIVPNGVDARFTPGNGGAVARRQGIDGPYVLHVGSLEPRKGLDPLIAAAGGAPWRLVLAGAPGFDGERIERAARAAGAMLLRDASDADLVDLYRGAHAVALPALYEGFGIVALEAMACGAPVAVAAQAGALEEVAGDAAVVVRERTADAWRAAIADADARRAELAARGRERAAPYDWDASAASMRVVLREAAGK